MTASELAFNALAIAALGIGTWGLIVPPNLFTADVRDFNKLVLQFSPRKVAIIWSSVSLLLLLSLRRLL